MVFKPMLAAAAPSIDKIKFPVLASPKLDGIRCIISDERVAVTRSLKPIPNAFIRKMLSTAKSRLDGEIITYTDGEMDDFNTVQSKVMSADGDPDFKFHVFDLLADIKEPFSSRLIKATNLADHPWCLSVPHTMVMNADHMDLIEAENIELRFEGTMIRDPKGPYKFGRSTAREGYLLKIKRFEDDEAEITGSVERMHNTNEAKTNALGRTERSSAKAGLVPMGTLGALQCIWKGITFEIGTGLDDATRQHLWDIRDSLPGKLVTFKYQGVGSGGAPRFPVYRGIRGDL